MGHFSPKGARLVDPDIRSMMAWKMDRVLGGRKENHLFI